MTSTLPPQKTAKNPKKVAASASKRPSSQEAGGGAADTYATATAKGIFSRPKPKPSTRPNTKPADGAKPKQGSRYIEVFTTAENFAGPGLPVYEGEFPIGQPVYSLIVAPDTEAVLEFRSIRYTDPAVTATTTSEGIVRLTFLEGSYPSIMDFVAVGPASFVPGAKTTPAIIDRITVQAPQSAPAPPQQYRRTSIYSPEWAEGTVKLDNFRRALAELYSYGQNADTWQAADHEVPAASGGGDGSWLSEYALNFSDVARIHGFPTDVGHPFHHPNADPSMRCSHDIAAFPSWHRRYTTILTAAFVQAYQTLGLGPFPGLPYWNWTSATAADTNAIPPQYRYPTYQDLQGREQPNPLYSAPLPNSLIVDPSTFPSDEMPAGSTWFGARYRTRRGEEGYGEAMSDYVDTDMTGDFGGDSLALRVARAEFQTDFLSFACTKQRSDWVRQGNESLEEPHNLVHLFTGGYNLGPVYGNMSLNESAAWDPIFFLHHAFVDRVYSSWQVSNPDRNANLDELYADELDPATEGTSLNTALLNFPPWAGPPGEDYWESNTSHTVEQVGFQLDLPVEVTFTPFLRKRRSAMAGAEAAVQLGTTEKGLPGHHSHQRFIRLNGDQSVHRPNEVDEIEMCDYYATKEHLRPGPHHQQHLDHVPRFQDRNLSQADASLVAHAKAINALGEGVAVPPHRSSESAPSAAGQKRRARRRARKPDTHYHLQAIFKDIPIFEQGGGFLLQAVDTRALPGVGARDAGGRPVPGAQEKVVGMEGYFVGAKREKCHNCLSRKSKVTGAIDLGHVANPVTDRSRPLNRYKFRVVRRDGTKTLEEAGIPKPKLFYREYNLFTCRGQCTA